MAILLFRTLTDFEEWYRKLGKLKIFWAKPVNKFRLIEDRLFVIEWNIRRKRKKAFLLITNGENLSNAIKVLSDKEGVKLLIASENTYIDLSLVNAKSILYFWDLKKVKTLTPNPNVRFTVLENWNTYNLKVFEKIQKMSWGFFIPPREDDHLVILGLLESKTIGLAYLNIHNFNIDYGIHVVKSYWRRRIGTSILVKVLEIAREMNSTLVSVVRIFRHLNGTSSDRRAIAFLSS